MKIRVKVVDINHRDIGPWRAGMAEIFIDDKLHAAIRTEEVFEIEIKDPEFATSTRRSNG